MQLKLTAEELAQELRDRYTYNPLTGELSHRRLAHKKIGKQNARYRMTSIMVNGQIHRFSVHYAVWLWFYGAAPEQTIDHINRDKNDNRIWNLRDVDMFEQNRNASGAKLNVDAVKVIKQRLRNGELQRVIAADYGVHKGTISEISKGNNWRNVA